MSLLIATAAPPQLMGADAEVIVPSDTVSQGPYRKIYVGSAAGDITLVTLNGNVVLFKAVPIGMLEVGCVRVNATGTTSTLLVGIT